MGKPKNTGFANLREVLADADGEHMRQKRIKNGDRLGGELLDLALKLNVGLYYRKSGGLEEFRDKALALVDQGARLDLEGWQYKQTALDIVAREILSRDDSYNVAVLLPVFEKLLQEGANPDHVFDRSSVRLEIDRVRCRLDCFQAVVDVFDKYCPPKTDSIPAPEV